MLGLKTGKLTLVSQGPGETRQMTAAAAEAIARASHVVCYRGYAEYCRELFPGKVLMEFGLGQERERARAALEQATGGDDVVLISSGDIGVYGMASVVMEEMEREPDKFADLELETLPGVTAALASASILGAPLSHDFASLSLSDLLCPFEWIERRAKALADCDMVVALYNVRSRKRRDHLRRVIDIFLEARSPDTVCGLVRNAYREDQNAEICTLANLPVGQADMFTTIIIGNSHTREFRGKIYTRRGYFGWNQLPVSSQPRQEHHGIPENAYWVFSGTGDGNDLAGFLKEQDPGTPVVLSVATEYGVKRARQARPDCHVVSGPLGFEKRASLLQQCSARAIIDATHPFATGISDQLTRIADKLKLPIVRYERASCLDSIHFKRLFFVDSCSEAAALASRLGSRVFLATGAKHIKVFLDSGSLEAESCFVRVTPSTESLEQLLQAGIPGSNICAMQGPFSNALNRELFTNWNIDCVVLRDSGAAGGFLEKVLAASELKIPVVAIRRPYNTDKAYNSDNSDNQSRDLLFRSEDFSEILSYLKKERREQAL